MAVIRNIFKLVLQITKPNADGTTTISEHQISRCETSFAMNKIPLCDCAVAAGISVHTGEVAKIHEEASELRVMLPAKVILRPEGPFEPNNDFGWSEAGDYPIFDGYLTGTGYTRIYGKLYFTMQLIHWLSDLAFSSALSNQSHPANPSDIAFRDAYNPPCADAQTASLRAFTTTDRFYRYFDRDAITNDFWGQVIHPLLCCLAQEDAIQLGLCAGGPEEPIPNYQSLQALSRFETDTGVEGSCGIARRWSVPLSLGGGLVGNALAKGIQRYFAKEYTESYWGTTMWDKLVQQFAPTFKFAVIPRVEDALIVPFMPGLRAPYRVRIFDRDIDGIDVKSFIRRPLRGVGIYAGREVRTSASSAQTSSIYGELGAGGCYIPDLEAQGMLLIQRAPGWLINVTAAASSPAVTTTGTRDGAEVRQPTSTATTPLPEGTAESGALRPTEDPRDAAVNSGSVFENLARWIYIAEVLRGRNGMLVTKPRFDIAPGTNLAFHVSGDRFVIDRLGSDDLQRPFFATVTRVVTLFDADNAQGQTTLQLAHVRTSEENEDDRTSVDFHPLYPGQDPYLGAPLVNSYLFTP